MKLSVPGRGNMGPSESQSLQERVKITQCTLRPVRKHNLISNLFSLIYLIILQMVLYLRREGRRNEIYLTIPGGKETCMEEENLCSRKEKP
jgi:hypothetical protein